MSFKQKLIFTILLIFCVFVQITPVIRSGLIYDYGIGYWGPSGHDSVWHLSLINHINNPLSIDMPVYAGAKLKNYHPFFDILISTLSSITKTNSSVWLFQIYPIVSSILFVYLSFILGKLITNNFFGGLLLMATNSLSNSFGWLISIFRFGNFSGESMFWAMQSPSNQINQPYSLSLIFILILLYIIYKQKHSSGLSPNQSLIVFILLVLLPITKSYSAIVGFGVFGIYTLISYSKTRNIKNIILLILSFLVAYILFTIYNPNPSSLLVFKPFWFVNSMIDSTDKLFLPKLSSYRNTLESMSVFNAKLILIYLFSVLVFIVGNYSWRLFGLFSLANLSNYFNKSILFLIVVLTVIPMFFIQKGTSWNTIQFMYYALFLSNIFLSLYLNNVYHKKYGKLLIIVIFASSFLAYIGMAPNYFGKLPPASLPTKEIQALSFLSSQPKGTVLTVPYDKFIKSNYPIAPVPLYAYESTSYVSAYSHQKTYLEDEMNVGNSGYDLETRRYQSSKFFLQQNINEDRGFLVNNQIDYIYITGLQKRLVNLNTQSLSLILLFENPDVLIYRVQR